MGEYQKASLAEVESAPTPATAKLELDELFDTTEFGLNVYTVEPGEMAPWGFHTHPDHEEAFLVCSGELTFETPDGDYVVGPDEAFFVPPGNGHRAVATGEEPTRMIAVGAPKDRDHAVIEAECPTCGEVTEQDLDPAPEEADVLVRTCAECDTETLRAGKT